MSRRLGILASIILVLFVLVAAQAASIQFLRAPALDASNQNPRNHTNSTLYPRGEIVAADGTILAESVRTGNSAYPYLRSYPLGSLTAGVVGFTSPFTEPWGLEAEYNSNLTAHTQPASSFEQLLAPTSAADSLTLTLEPVLNKIAAANMTGQDGAAVVIDPRTGSVLGMYSNPTYNPTLLESTNSKEVLAAFKRYTTNDAHGFPPLGLVATQQTFPPGSTFKVITTAAVVAGRPDLLQKSYHHGSFTTLPDSNKLLYNDGGTSCGGTIAVMLPASCDPGFALVGLDVGAKLMTSTANSFGYNEVPPLDFPNIVPSYFPSAASFTTNLAGLAYSAIGQENVRATALQQALVAAAIANGGAIMTPHLMSSISSPDGAVFKRFQDSVWKRPLTSAQAAQIVPLMENVVKDGTATTVHFLAADDVAAKTGTAQTGNSLKNTDDWMIAFAPATHPTVAVAVVMPFQAQSAYGATVAGPIVKCLIEGALALQAGLPTTGTSTTCAS
jgi:peptidoglycan glycosyltransferase